MKEDDFLEICLQDIQSHYQYLSNEAIQSLYEKAQKEIFHRIEQLSSFENIDIELLYDDERLMNEIRNSIRNLTLSYIQFERDAYHYANKYDDIFDFVSREQLNNTFFEQSVTEGHPFHPMTKTKLGFNLHEVLNYSPEFRNAVKIIPVLCETRLVNIFKREDTSQIDALKQKVKKYCLANGISFEQYEILLLHEWQVTHFLNTNYAELLNNNQVIPLYELAIDGNPLLSFRTLDVESLKCVVKTAVNVQATSAVRNVSPTSIHNGITLSHLVETIYKNNNYRNCFIQKDLSGGYLNYRQEDANKCSYIIREKIPKKSHTHNVVCASLITTSFITNKPIIVECIEQIMQQHQLSFSDATTQFMKRYSEILLEATYRLLTEEHISLEAHMQNSTVVLENGFPKAIYIRDFGGVRLFDRDSDDSDDIDNTTGLLTDDFSDLISVFTHSVLYNHLFQLIAILENYGYHASLAYNIIRNIISDYNVHTNPMLNILNQPTFKIKALLKMRIYSEGYDYQYTEIKNPLFSEAKLNELD